MKSNRVRQWSSLVAIGAAMAACAASAEGQINVMCSVPVAWCEAVVGQYQRETGVRVNMTQKAAGEALAQRSPRRPIRNTTSGTPAPVMHTCRRRNRT